MIVILSIVFWRLLGLEDYYFFCIGYVFDFIVVMGISLWSAKKVGSIEEFFTYYAIMGSG